MEGGEGEGVEREEVKYMAKGVESWCAKERVQWTIQMCKYNIAHTCERTA